MIQRFFNALNQPLGRVGALIVLLALLSGGVWGIAQTQKTPQQPIDFPHNIHVGVLHIPCLYCHPGAFADLRLDCQQRPSAGDVINNWTLPRQVPSWFRWFRLCRITRFAMGAGGVGAGFRSLCSPSPHRGGVELRGLSWRCKQDDPLSKPAGVEYGLVFELSSGED